MTLFPDTGLKHIQGLIKLTDLVLWNCLRLTEGGLAVLVLESSTVAEAAPPRPNAFVDAARRQVAGARREEVRRMLDNIAAGYEGN